MDKAVRNRIQNPTQAARRLLEETYQSQLEGKFDILLDGSIAGEPSHHLSAAERVVREKLVATIAHYESNGMKPAEAVAAYLREASFTTLNRFVALKMLEARELVQECVSKGEESSGFKEFGALAPGLVTLPDKGYRLYIESIFDEIGQEVRVLFDRHDAASLLWPGRQALVGLLEILNDSELGSVWKEDETIGWVYQYFNSGEERQQMRKESQAPRNSRELAVRNQFFTPRYVVQFLTENTLGRIWYEMRQGETKLRDLDYLVRQPSEIFLGEGEEAPADPKDCDQDLSHEELFRGPAYVRFRAEKDPRDLRVLDPACGSGHFLLYAFDLLLTIYEEAWTVESTPTSEITGRSLRQDYPDLDSLRSATPELVLRCNLHGIDIDARCGQIAALALWMRAQRAYKDLGFAREARPAIKKTNIVVAEAMPGGQEMRQEFVATLRPKLRELIERFFDRMELAGEAGSLLRIEEDLRTIVREIYGEHGTLFRAADRERWEQLEHEVLAALHGYAEHTGNERAYQRRLFAEDAARGLGFLDLCGMRYDAVLMNPPFGFVPDRVKNDLQVVYPDSVHEVYGQFLLSSLELSNGLVGALTSRAFLLLPNLTKLRNHLYGHLTCLLDLGSGVLDDAFVEVCATVLSAKGTARSVTCFDARHADTNHLTGVDLPRPTSITLNELKVIPSQPFCYDIPRPILKLFGHDAGVESRIAGCVTGVGIATGNNKRFLRLSWEVPAVEIGSRWHWHAKGGEYLPYQSDLHLVIDWTANGSMIETSFVGARIHKHNLFFKPGATYSRRSIKGLSFRALPAGSICGEKGPSIVASGHEFALLAMLNSTPFLHLVSLQSAASSFEIGTIRRTPIPEIYMQIRSRLDVAGRALTDAFNVVTSLKESHPLFAWPKTWFTCKSVDELAKIIAQELSERRVSALEHIAEVDKTISDAYDWPLRPGPDQYEKRLESLEPEKSEKTRVFELTLAVILARTFGHFRRCVRKPRSAFTEYPQGWGCRDDSRQAGLWGILHDDRGHEDDLTGRFKEAARLLFRTEEFEVDLLEELRFSKGLELRAWLRHEAFPWHLARFSRSRRKAPVFWQLSTPTADYSVWLYYHRLTKDTLYRILNDYVAPKLQNEERRLTDLLRDGGPNPPASQRKEIVEQEAFVEELRTFREEVARVAPLWQPNLNDGVIINFAPLWRLSPHHRAWQNDCRRAWGRLVGGDDDWAHLALHLWPERVVPKCADDRSLAIAHDLEEVFWQESGDGKWSPREVDEATVRQLIAERTSPAVKAALQDLLSAPLPTGGKSRRRKKSVRRRPKPQPVSMSAPSPRTQTRSKPAPKRSAPAVDQSTLDAVRDAIGAVAGGAAKSDVLTATGLSTGQWTAAINALLAEGTVTKTGAKRGTRYHLEE